MYMPACILTKKRQLFENNDGSETKQSKAKQKKNNNKTTL